MQQNAKAIDVDSNVAGVAPLIAVADCLDLVAPFHGFVPDSFEHSRCLELFQGEHAREFSFLHPSFNDKNYAGASIRLVPGRRFRAEIFRFEGGMVITADEILRFLTSRNAMPVGAQGLAIAYAVGKKYFPEGWVVSFDKKDALWEFAAGDHIVPGIERRDDNSISTKTGRFEGVWVGPFSVLCFRYVG